MQQLPWQNINDSQRLKLPAFFNFEECYHFLGRNEEECLHALKNNCVYRAINHHHQLFLIEISADEKYLYVNCLNQQPDNFSWAYLLKYVEEWLDLGRPLKGFYQLGKNDPILNPLIEKYDGLRLIRMPELFEAISWAILGQQINLTFAYRLKKRWVLEANNYIKYDGNMYYTLPSPTQTLAISDERFRELQFSRQKTNYLKRIAEHLQENNLSKEKLALLAPDQMLESLTALKGIGPWTANYVMMKCLGVTSAFPIQDVGLHNALKIQLDRAEKPAIKEIRELAKSWHPWEAYATFYLWRSLIFE